MNKKNYNIKDFKFQHEIKTRWKDLDAFGHVNNAVFLSYVEDARILFFKRWNINYKERSLIVASAKIDYIRQVSHPSELIIGQRISRIGNKSFDIQSVIFLKEDMLPVCESTVISVAFDFTQNKPIKIYQSIIDDYNS
tara:strand:+ start:65 stop:478 length:414 start_codon:yes stop_codon:yes gene_type:complete